VTASRIRVANAPVSWGALEIEGFDQKPIAYDVVLDEIAETGYAGTELGDWGFMPTDPAVLRDELERRGLALIGAFVPVRLRDRARAACRPLVGRGRPGKRSEHP
jgi:inosose dehydratase